jgi:DNA-binding transcriptional LysR family regulator
VTWLLRPAPTFLFLAAIVVTGVGFAAKDGGSPEVDVEMHQIQYFLAVARSLNFTRAAEALQISQPSLTKAVRKLEAELGGALFRRERMNTHLTELGRLVLPDLQATLAAAGAARQRAHRLRLHEVGSLALGVAMGLDTERVIRPFIDVARQLNGLDVTVAIADGDAIRRDLIKGDIDAAVLGVDRDDIDRLDIVPIETDTPVVAFASGHRFSRAHRIAFEELGAEPLATWTRGWADAALATAMEARRLPRVVRYRSNDLRWIAELVRNGLAVAAMPQTSAEAFGLRHRGLADVSLQHRSVLATVAGRRHSRAVAMLVQHFKKAAPPSLAKAPDVCDAS